MSDIENLIESTFPFVKKLLLEYGEFYPVACAINSSGDIVQIGIYNEDDHPLSETLLTDLKKASISQKQKYKVIAIFYDVTVSVPKSYIKTDAVAIFVESSTENF